jgi:hypothetical protein
MRCDYVIWMLSLSISSRCFCNEAPRVLSVEPARLKTEIIDRVNPGDVAAISSLKLLQDSKVVVAVLGAVTSMKTLNLQEQKIVALIFFFSSGVDCWMTNYMSHVALIF